MRPVALAFVGATLLGGCQEGSSGGGSTPAPALSPVPSPPPPPPPEPLELDSQSFVDVVARGADPTGAIDATAVIKAAIREAVTDRKVCFFPAGQYRISRGLSIPVDGFGGGDSDIETCVLMGSRFGKATIRLDDNALEADPAAFDAVGPDSPLRYVINIWSRDYDYRTGDKWAMAYTPAREQPNTLYNSKLINLRVKIGRGNANAVAVHLRGAQGSGVQDVTIDLTEGGHTGLSGACGSGGAHLNVTVLGGRIGLDLTEAQPAPTVAGATLTDQSEAAILYHGRQALSATGIRILTNRSSGPIVRTPARTSAHAGQIALCDSTIDFTNGSSSNVAIATSSNLYLRDVYVRGARTLVQRLFDGGSTGSLLTTSLPGWVRVNDYARADYVSAPIFQEASGNYYSFPVYVAGVRQAGDLAGTVEPAAPPGDLLERHAWDALFPGWEHCVASVLSYGATRNDSGDDDSVGIQSALDANRGRGVFLPKGLYHIRNGIRLHPDSILIGAARHLSVLRAHTGGAFSAAGPSNPVAMVETDDAADAATAIAFLKIQLEGNVAGRATGLVWRAGRASIVRSVNFDDRYPGDELDMEVPFVTITGRGGGRWFEFFNTNSQQNQGMAYRHLLVTGTTEPLRFYQCNPEHAIPGGKTASGVTGQPQMEIRNAKHVTIFGLKGEGNSPMLWVENSDHVIVLGYGGNSSAMADDSLFRIRNTPNWLIAHAVDSPRTTDTDYMHFAGASVDPDSWSMLREVFAGVTYSTRLEIPAIPQGADRPALALRGTPRMAP